MRSKEGMLYFATDRADTVEEVVNFVKSSLASWKEKVKKEENFHPLQSTHQWCFVAIDSFPNDKLTYLLEAMRKAGLNSRCTTTTGDDETQLLFKFHVSYLIGREDV